jgi:hypothetical protein
MSASHREPPAPARAVPAEGLRRLPATRYVVPLREGGTLPAVVEVEDGGLWVTKFRGAGQGARALVAEILAGELARSIGLPVPEIALVEVPASLGRTERDPEIQDLLQASRGVNVGLTYLEGAFNFDPRAAADLVTPAFATSLVWFDALVTNPDRSPRNPNLMVHGGAAWLIDHGATLFAHFDWARVDRDRARASFPRIASHVLLGAAGDVLSVDAMLADRILGGGLERALACVPDELLDDPLLAGEFPTAEAHRARYRDYLEARLAGPRAFAEAAEAARRAHLAAAPRALGARR